MDCFLDSGSKSPSLSITSRKSPDLILLEFEYMIQWETLCTLAFSFTNNILWIRLFIFFFIPVFSSHTTIFANSLSLFRGNSISLYAQTVSRRKKRFGWSRSNILGRRRTGLWRFTCNVFPETRNSQEWRMPSRLSSNLRWTRRGKSCHCNFMWMVCSQFVHIVLHLLLYFLS